MADGVDETQIGTEGSGDAVPGAVGSDAAVQEYEIGGERLTREQLEEAVETWRDRDAWEASFKQRDQRHAAVRSAVEAGFGKKMTDFDDADLRDLKAFGLINSKLKAEPQFAKAWEESLVEAYKKAGMSGGEAKAQAKEDVAAAKAGEPVKLPAEVQAKLGRIDNIESMIVEQGMTQFRGVLENDVKSAIGKYAGDLGKFHPMVRMGVLQGIAGYTDVELLEKYQSGELQREVAQLARSTAKTIREHLGVKAEAAGAAVDKGKAGSAPAPTRGGGVAEKVEATEPQMGKGLKGMTSRLMKDLGGRV